MANLVSKRYATALFQIASEEGLMKDFETQAIVIREILTTEKDYLKVLNHPGVLLEEKITMIEAAFKGQVADTFVGMLVLLVKKGRQDQLIDILDRFIAMSKEVSGVLVATVTSAIPLKEEQLAQIKTNIEQKTGKTIELTSQVDTTLIGGMIVRVGDQVVDGSIRGKMDALKTQLTSLRLA